MSRVGKKPILLPAGIKAQVTGETITIEGPKGKLTQAIHPRLKLEVSENKIIVKRASDFRDDRALHGLLRNLIANMVTGVTAGFMKELEIVGVGYRAEMQGKALKMQLQFTHPIIYPAPAGITIEVPQPTRITVRGPDKQIVGQTAAEIRAFLPPDSYKGKGVRYVGEYVRRKAGKAVGGATAASG